MSRRAPSVQRLEERIRTTSSPAAIWGVLRDFGGVSQWAPHILSSSSVDGQPSGPGARRVFRHLWGFRLEEVITTWDEGLGYAFDVVNTPFVLRNVREAWSVDTASAGATVTTTVEYETPFGVLGVLLDRILLRCLIRHEMRVGLAGLKKYVESNGAGGD